MHLAAVAVLYFWMLFNFLSFCCIITVSRKKRRKERDVGINVLLCRIGSHGFRMNSGWKSSTADVNSSLWSETEGDKPHMRGFYPMPGSECVWSYGERGI